MMAQEKTGGLEIEPSDKVSDVFHREWVSAVGVI